MRIDTVLRKITATTQAKQRVRNGMLGGRPPAHGCLETASCPAIP